MLLGVQWTSDEWPHFIVYYIKAFIVLLVVPIPFPNAEGLLKLPVEIRPGTLVSPTRVNQEVSVQPGGAGQPLKPSA